MPLVPAPALDQGHSGVTLACLTACQGEAGEDREESRAALPCLMQHLRWVCQYLISVSLTHCPFPGRLRGAAFVCGTRRQAAAGKRPSVTAPFNCHLKIKGETGGGGSGGNWRLPTLLPLYRCPGIGMCCPRGGFNHVSNFLGFSDAV